MSRVQIAVAIALWLTLDLLRAIDARLALGAAGTLLVIALVLMVTGRSPPKPPNP